MSGPENPTPAERAVWSAYLGGAVAELLSPSSWRLWLVLPWVIRGLWATGWSESYMRQSAVGDRGTSVGVAQFQPRTWQSLGFVEVSDGRDARASVDLQGRASVRYVARSAPLARLLSLRYWRVLWTRGPSAPWTPTVGADLSAPGTVAARAWSSPPAAFWLSLAVWSLAPLLVGRAFLGALARNRRRR